MNKAATRTVAILLAAACAPLAPALAAQSAVHQADAEEADRLFARLKAARSEAEGRLLENAIWEMWMADAPSASVKADVRAAMEVRSSYDFDKALEILDRVVQAAPGYAEGWNQRAFIRFLKDDFDGALEDIDRALELEPRHFAALAGKALVLMRQGRMELGQAALREAVLIHPWLKERSMLIPLPRKKPAAPEDRKI